MIIFFMPGGIIYGLRVLRSKFLLIIRACPHRRRPSGWPSPRWTTVPKIADRGQSSHLCSNQGEKLMKPSWRWRVAMPITALALVAAACGSDDDGGASTEAPATEAPATEAPATEAAGHRGASHRSTGDRRRRQRPAFQVPTDNCPPEATDGARRR